jgi:hypothetical protein
MHKTFLTFNWTYLTIDQFKPFKKRSQSFNVFNPTLPLIKLSLLFPKTRVLGLWWGFGILGFGVWGFLGLGFWGFGFGVLENLKKVNL